MSANLRKCISLQPLGQQRDVNQFSYVFWNPPENRHPNRDFFRETNTKWIRLWADWSIIEPATRGVFDNDVLKHLDDQIKLANDDGLKVILCMWRFPQWANGSTNRNKPPTDVSTISYWAYWFRFLYERYNGDDN